MSKNAIKDDRSETAIRIDSAIRANTVFPRNPTPEQLAKWMSHPNRYDIEGVDTPPKKKKGTKTEAVTTSKVVKKTLPAKPVKEKKQCELSYEEQWQKDKALMSKLQKDLPAAGEYHEDMYALLEDAGYEDTDRYWKRRSKRSILTHIQRKCGMTTRPMGTHTTKVPEKDGSEVRRMSILQRKRNGSGKSKPRGKFGRRSKPRYGLTESELKAQSKIRVVSGDKHGKYEKEVRSVLRDSFTHAELRKIGEVDIRFGPVPYGNRAAFYGLENDDRVEILFDPKQIEDDDITHEFVHALKDADSTRKGWAAIGNVRHRLRWRDNRPDMRNIEEATVVAEAAIRTKRPAKEPSGYYKEIPGVGRDSKKMKQAYNEDRLILLDAPEGTKVRNTRGVQGKAAAALLNKNFEKTNIAKKTYRGRSALRSYERLKSGGSVKK